ncbi:MULTISPECIES: TIGR03905 family TSCPD domain-containing protein [Coprobacillaceae]|uniref:TIGR03905 family TSCPD domain-containing protein n=1 Tax=Coprobacillaceae TaxID=2810280 RepID=UPI000E502D4A|nr:MULTISPECIES: TIGR03905 family TSCPD domain-containing protein [Coprobacillaceae]RHM60602.1 TIGR03905 family TSCPD domain-containing protein [Coprobacillus sp. AF33-1AC]RHS93292.1 TIGR03905 family TSCPD domain-containing protein [Erysipelatoclostridium sp. AM42-17]
MEIKYQPHGVCASQIVIEVENDIVQNVKFIGGCSGNTQGVGALAKGMKVQDVIERLEGIRCGRKPTSCPDQLAQCLKENCQ